MDHSNSEARRTLRRQLEQQLVAHGLLLDDSVYRSFRERVMGEGTQQWHRWLRLYPARQRDWRPLALHLDLQVQTIPRVLGFGSLQADALAQALDVPAEHRSSVAELGALFNLGIVLFDWLLDHSPEHAGLLQTTVTHDRLSKLLDGQAVVLDPDPPPAIDCLFAIIAHFCQRSGALDAGLATGRALRAVLETMYAAEVGSASGPSPDGTAIGLGTQMRAKSVLPVWTMALACLHRRHPPLTQADVQRREQQIVPLGEMLWWIDDMVDLVDDWETRSWNRLWRQWQDGPAGQGSIPDSIDEAFQSLLAAGILHQAIGDLVKTWDHVRSTFPSANDNRPLDICWRATIQSWVYGLPA